MPEITSFTNVEPNVWFDPNKGFHELRVVRRGLAFVGVACAALIIIAFSDLPPLLLDPNGLREFAARLQVPLGAFTLTIPFFALMAAAHRSEQTKNQMELTRAQIARTDNQILLASDQNNFSNLYKHLEQFGEYCKEHVGHPFKVSSPRKMHSWLYPRAREGELAVDRGVVHELNGDVDEFVELAEQFAFETGREYAIRRITVIAERLVKKFHLGYMARTGSEFHLEGAAVFVPGEGAQGFIRHNLLLFSTIDGILKFDVTYETSSTLRSFSAADLASIPHTNVMTSAPFHLKKLLNESVGLQVGIAQANK